MILGVPSSASSTLAGFRSRWMTPFSWAACIARASVSTSARRLLRRQRRAGELPVQAAAGAELQREEGQAVVLADLEDLHDVGVLQAGDGLRLGAEAGQVGRRRRGRRPGSSSGRRRGPSWSCRAL